MSFKESTQLARYGDASKDSCKTQNSIKLQMQSKEKGFNKATILEKLPHYTTQFWKNLNASTRSKEK